MTWGPGESWWWVWRRWCSRGRRMKSLRQQLKIIENPRRRDWQKIMHRISAGPNAAVRRTVNQILRGVRSRGEEAIRQYTRTYDGAFIKNFRVSRQERKRGAGGVQQPLREAIQMSIRNIEKYHRFYCFEEREVLHTLPGVTCFQRTVPIQRVGLYVPGGKAPLFSTLLMLGVPARIAGCPEIVVCTPPRPDGSVHPVILYCADILGVDMICKVGGAQAIGALAVGTSTVPRVDKIFGPGNIFVTEAKRQVQADGVATDLPAGPSELMIVGDESADPEFAAVDFLSQLEHGPHSQSLMLSTDRKLLESVSAVISRRMDEDGVSPMIRTNLAGSYLIYFANQESLIDLMNGYAPEHLQLSVRDPEGWVNRVRHAGSVFLGHFSAESLGDYAAGPNHTLPTGGSARAYTGIEVDSYRKRIFFQQATREGFAALAPAVSTMAEAENLYYHRESVWVRQREAADPAPAPPDPWGRLSQHVKDLEPYVTARHGHRQGPWTSLDANELPVSLLRGTDINRYPDPGQWKVKGAIAALKEISEEEILLGNGSDEVIDLLIRAFCIPGRDRILLCPPTYGMYEVSARLNRVEVVPVPLGTDFSLDTDAVVEQARGQGVKLIFVNSPNNPTGNAFPREKIERILRDSGTLVVVDEAYVDFSGDPGLLPLIRRYRNLFIMQTFSKSWGGAGLRVGVLFGERRVLGVLSRVKPPYNISSPGQKMLLKLLKRGRAREKAIAGVVLRRDKLRRDLAKCRMVRRVYPSQGNFLLVKVREKERLMGYLEERGLGVRDRGEAPGCRDCIRITIGTRGEMRQLSQTFRDFEEDAGEKK